MWDHLLREANAANCLLQDEYLLDKLSHLLIGLNWYGFRRSMSLYSPHHSISIALMRPVIIVSPRREGLCRVLRTQQFQVSRQRLGVVYEERLRLYARKASALAVTSASGFEGYNSPHLVPACAARTRVEMQAKYQYFCMGLLASPALHAKRGRS